MYALNCDVTSHFALGAQYGALHMFLIVITMKSTYFLLLAAEVEKYLKYEKIGLE